MSYQLVWLLIKLLLVFSHFFSVVRFPRTALGAAMCCVLMFAPVGYGGATVKICPPLMITDAALDESLTVFEEVVAEVLAKQEAVA